MALPNSTAPAGHILSSRNCFVCGKPGILSFNSYHCPLHPEGWVIWSQYTPDPIPRLNSVVMYDGLAIEIVDYGI